MEWPDYYPSDCPPVEAVDAVGGFFRLVQGETVVEADFESLLSQAFRGARRTPPAGTEIMAAGVSIQKAQADAEATRKRVPALKNRRIAQGQIDGEGKLMHTPSKTALSHHTWWRPIGDRAWSTFAVVT